MRGRGLFQGQAQIRVWAAQLVPEIRGARARPPAGEGELADLDAEVAG
ncbi:hypothetical protein J2X50_000858 [Aminobacter sp. BE322]